MITLLRSSFMINSPMKVLRKPANFWTEDRVIEAARKFKSYSEFLATNYPAYRAAQRFGLLVKVRKLLKSSIKEKNYWNLERVSSEAKKYKTRNDFYNSSYSAHQAARRLGVLDHVCRHMERNGNKFTRAIYAIEFTDKSVYVGLTMRYHRRLKDHLSSDSSVGAKMRATKHKIILFENWQCPDDAAKAERETIEKYRKSGWKVLNRMPAGALGGKTLKWNKEMCLAEAKKFSNRYEFQRLSGSAYNSAWKNKWLDEACSHMPLVLNRKH
jgi:predicted GIY-YIG superfamily endonuclease